MNNTAVLCRKSTNDKKKQQLSLETQEKWCREYIEKNDNINVITWVTVSESASKIGRKGFEEFISKIEDGSADTILCMYFDRLFRNPLDSARVQDLLIRGKLKKIITHGRIFTQEDAGILFSVESGLNIEHVLKIKKGVRDGFKILMQQGRYFSQAPIGYLNDTEKHIIIVDPERGFYIPKIFNLRLDGFSARAIRDIVHDLGLRSKKGKRVSVQCIEAVLKNPFYYGWIQYNGEMFDKGELYEGAHTPLITKEVFDKVNNTFRKSKYNHSRELTYLKGKVFHKESDKVLCDSLNTSNKYGRPYIYFHLHHRHGKLWCNQKLIIEYFDENIQNYAIPEEYQPEVGKILYSEYYKEVDTNSSEMSVLRRKITENENKLKGYGEMRAMKELTGEEYIELKNKLKLENIDYEKTINDLEEINEQLLLDFNRMVELFFNSINKRNTYDDKKKSFIISLIVVELFFDNKKRLYIEEKPLFKAINIVKNQVWSGGRGLNSHTQGLKP